MIITNPTDESIDLTGLQIPIAFNRNVRLPSSSTFQPRPPSEFVGSCSSAFVTGLDAIPASAVDVLKLIQEQGDMCNFMKLTGSSEGLAITMTGGVLCPKCALR